MTIDELKALIEYHDDLYYNQGAPEISDAEYDALRQQLLDLDKDSLNYVPGEPTGLFPKYEHTHPIASLGKVNTEEGLRKEVEKLLPVVVMPKFDGLTVVTYPDAHVTRGDGSIGDNISINFNKVCRQKFSVPVRGEAIIKRDDFIALNDLRRKNGEEEFKNRRNAAAGILRGKDGKYMEFISYVVFEAVGSTLPLTEDLAQLEEAGFRTTDYWEFDNVDDVVDFIQNFNKDSYLFELDGLVIKTNQPNSEERFGRTSHHPKDAIAFKFEAQGGWTTLNYVHWTVGRTGKVVPNAVFDPIEILDTTVSNATLHNKAIIEALKLSEGCRIHVVKANDIIPAIIKSEKYNPLKKIQAPTHCPKCGTKLSLENDQLYCYNSFCKSRVVANTVYLASKSGLDISGLSEATIEKLLDAGFIRKPADVLLVTKEELLTLEGFAEKSAEKMYNAIQAARITTLNRVIAAAGIPLVGRAASKEIAKVYKDLTELAMDHESNFSKLQDVEGIGEGIIGSLYAQFSLISDVVNNLIAVENPLYEDPDKIQDKKMPEEVYTIVVTGKFDKPRDHFKGLIEDSGHTFGTSVTKKTTHLLAGEKAGSKLKKAQELGITIIQSEGELLELIGG